MADEIAARLAELAPEARAKVESALKATLEKEIASLGGIAARRRPHDRTHDRTGRVLEQTEQPDT